MNALSDKIKSKVATKPSAPDWDATFQLLSWWKKEVVQNARVMVVGAGALGNEVLKNLALLNVGTIVIVDFDDIEYSNLCRSILFREKDCEGIQYKAEVAAKSIKDINSKIQVGVIKGDITADVGLGLIREMDVIIGCLDNRIARLFMNRACHKVGKTWIDAGIENLTAQVNVYTPGKSCYECNLTKADWKNIDAQMSCADVATWNEKKGRIPTTPISASIAAAIQVQEALKVIHGYEEKSMVDKALYYEGMNNTILQLQPSPLKSHCYSHFHYDPILSAPISWEDSVQQLIAWLREAEGMKAPIIHLDSPLVREVISQQSEVEYEVNLLKQQLKRKLPEMVPEFKTEGVFIGETIEKVAQDSPYVNWNLKDLGIPPFHILRITDDGEEYFVALQADKDYLSNIIY